MKFIVLSLILSLLFPCAAHSSAALPHSTSHAVAVWQPNPIEPSLKKQLFSHKKPARPLLPKKSKSQQLEDALFKSFVGVFFIGFVLFCVGFPLNIGWLWIAGLVLETGLLLMGLFLVLSSLIFSQGKGNFRRGELLFYLSGWAGLLIWLFFKGLAALIFGLGLHLSWLWIAGAAALGLTLILALIYIELVNLWA